MGPLGGASTSAVVALFALWHTTLGRGPFGTLEASAAQKVFTLQIFLTILSLMAMTLAAVVAERRRAERFQLLLVDAGAVLAASLDVHETIPRVARLVVPRTCTGFAVWVENGNGLLERIAHAGWDSSREARVRGVLPPLPEASRRWRTEEGTVVLAPLWVQGKAQGALVLMSDELAWCSGTADLRLAEDLAHRFSMALENARLYEEARLAIEVRNEFIAIAAHELRTPLTALTLRMRSLEGMLHRERASPRPTTRSARRHASSGGWASSWSSCWTWAASTQARWRSIRERVEVHELIEQVVEGFSEEARRVGSALRVEAEAGLVGVVGPGPHRAGARQPAGELAEVRGGQPIELHVSRQGTGCASS